jgi:hypothetical protein
VDAEFEIGGESSVDISRVGEMECIHGLYEFIETGICTDTSIVEFFLSDGTHRLSGVVVSWVDSRGIWECIEMIHDRVIESLRRSLLEVSTTRLADEEGISSEYHIIDMV